MVYACNIKKVIKGDLSNQQEAIKQLNQVKKVIYKKSGISPIMLWKI